MNGQPEGALGMNTKRRGLGRGLDALLGGGRDKGAEATGADLW